MRIEAGAAEQVVWGDGNWVFLDIGFSRNAQSCGLLVSDDKATCVTFADARKRIAGLAQAGSSPLHLCIEAPLSVCFDEGNPMGRMRLEKDGIKTRYWYNGLGCAVMVAAMYLVRDLHQLRHSGVVRLFEGFVSYKDRSVPSDHQHDAELLRAVVRDPAKSPGAILSRLELEQDGYTLQSAFCVMGLDDCGIPAVIRPQSS